MLFSILLPFALLTQGTQAATAPKFSTQVVKCTTADSEGQGTTDVVLVNYDDGELDAAHTPSCKVVYHYMYEYGSDEGFDGMYSMETAGVGNLKCEITPSGQPEVSQSKTIRKSGKRVKVWTSYAKCALTAAK